MPWFIERNRTIENIPLMTVWLELLKWIQWWNATFLLTSDFLLTTNRVGYKWGKKLLFVTWRSWTNLRFFLLIYLLYIFTQCRLRDGKFFNQEQQRFICSMQVTYMPLFGKKKLQHMHRPRLWEQKSYPKDRNQNSELITSSKSMLKMQAGFIG